VKSLELQFAPEGSHRTREASRNFTATSAVHAKTRAAGPRPRNSIMHGSCTRKDPSYKPRLGIPPDARGVHANTRAASRTWRIPPHATDVHKFPRHESRPRNPTTHKGAHGILLHTTAVCTKTRAVSHALGRPAREARVCTLLQRPAQEARVCTLLQRLAQEARVCIPLKRLAQETRVCIPLERLAQKARVWRLLQRAAQEARVCTLLQRPAQEAHVCIPLERLAQEARVYIPLERLAQEAHVCIPLERLAQEARVYIPLERLAQETRVYIPLERLAQETRVCTLMQRPAKRRACAHCCRSRARDLSSSLSNYAHGVESSLFFPPTLSTQLHKFVAARMSCERERRIKSSATGASNSRVACRVARPFDPEGNLRRAQLRRVR
jgi:hypothetical protein